MGSVAGWLQLLLFVVPHVCRGSRFELFQFDDRAWPLFYGANRAFCKQSACCDSWNVTTSLGPEDATVPKIWAKVKAFRDRLQVTRSESLVWLDSDAFFLDAKWCPEFDDDAAMLITPDPVPWHRQVNTGFFVVKASDEGKRLFEDYWGLWRRKYARRWEGNDLSDPDAPCPHRRPLECHWGHRFASQQAFTADLLPHFRHVVRSLPKNTTNADLETCDGTIKHLAAERWREEPQYNTLSRCLTYWTPPKNLTKEEKEKATLLL